MSERSRLKSATASQWSLNGLGFLIVLATTFALKGCVGQVVNRRMMFSEGWPTLFWAVVTLIWIPLAPILGWNAAAIIFRAGRRKRQIKRDLQATMLVTRLEQGHDEPFSLYLRSFSLEQTWRRRKGLWWYLAYEGRKIDAETLELALANGANRDWPMVTLGESGALGGGRLSAGGSWEDFVRFLMEKASVIFIVPGTTPGILAEMTMLLEHHAKTVYIMPSADFYQGDARRAEQDWQDAAAACAPFGICLPPYSAKGSSFRLDSQGSFRETFAVLGLRD